MPKSSSFIIAILLAILVSACNIPASRTATPPSPSQPDNNLFETYPVDPVCQGLYDFLGGETIVGPAIAPLVESGDLKTQYLQAAQMVYDPMAPESDRFQLESLGRMFGMAEPSLPDPGLPEVRYSNGHIILDEFVNMPPVIRITVVVSNNARFKILLFRLIMGLNYFLKRPVFKKINYRSI